MSVNSFCSVYRGFWRSSSQWWLCLPGAWAPAPRALCWSPLRSCRLRPQPMTDRWPTDNRKRKRVENLSCCLLTRFSFTQSHVKKTQTSLVLLWCNNWTFRLGSPHLVVAGHIGNSSVFSCQVVLHLVNRIVLAVDRTDQHVVGDVIQMTTELQPRPGSADVVCGAFALHLQMKEEALKQSHCRPITA